MQLGDFSFQEDPIDFNIHLAALENFLVSCWASSHEPVDPQLAVILKTEVAGRTETEAVVHVPADGVIATSNHVSPLEFVKATTVLALSAGPAKITGELIGYPLEFTDWSFSDSIDFLLNF